MEARTAQPGFRGCCCARVLRHYTKSLKQQLHKRTQKGHKYAVIPEDARSLSTVAKLACRINNKQLYMTLCSWYYYQPRVLGDTG
jgi:hypothetical protein